MKLGTSALSVFLGTLFWPQTVSLYAQQKPQDWAQKAAGSWLAVCDAGKYAGYYIKPAGM